MIENINKNLYRRMEPGEISGLMGAINLLYDRGIRRISEDVRVAILHMSFVLLYAVFMMYHSGSFVRIFYTHTQRHIIGAVLLLAIALFSMKGPIRERRYNKAMVGLRRLIIFDIY